MIELLRAPVVIAGKVPSMANLHINWRMTKVPLERLKHPGARKRREAYDYAMAWRDAAVAALRAGAIARAPKGVCVFIFVEVAFKPPKKSKAGFADESDLAADIDNPSKAILDCIQKAGIVANDKQVVRLLIDKVCAAGETQAIIKSICAARPRDRACWLAKVGGL